MTDRPLSYWVAVARMGFEDDFSRILDDLGISQVELAERLGTSPAYVSKILSGKPNNFQIETLTKLARAIGAILQIRLIKEDGEVVRVVDYQTARALDASKMIPAKSVNKSDTSLLANLRNFQDYLPAATSSRMRSERMSSTPDLVERMKHHG